MAIIFFLKAILGTFKTTRHMFDKKWYMFAITNYFIHYIYLQCITLPYVGGAALDNVG